MFDTSLRTTEFLATLALTPVYGVKEVCINTLRTGDADLCFYITTVQDG